MSVQNEARTIVFVDPSVEDYQTLLQGIDPAAKVILLNPNQDGIQQITSNLSSRSDLESLHIISHGSQGKL